AHHDSDHCGPFLSASDDTTAHFLPTAADATRIPSRPQELLELEFEHPGKYARRICALPNTVTPKAYSLSGIGELPIAFAAHAALAESDGMAATSFELQRWSARSRHERAAAA